MSDEASDDDSYGPALPPHLQVQRPIGPQLPASFLRKAETKEGFGGSNTNGTSTTVIREIVESESNDKESEDDDSDGGIGPYPPDDPRSHISSPKRLVGTTSSSTKLKREEWMLIPPKNKTIAEVIGQQGLTSRKFLGRTPDEVKPPEGEQEAEPDFLETARAEFDERCAQERDERMVAMLEEAKAGQTNESLLHIHRKRRKVVEEVPSERRPFDRDVDLKVGGLSAEDKEKFIKKTTELTSRFHGGKQKFL